MTLPRLHSACLLLLVLLACQAVPRDAEAAARRSSRGLFLISNIRQALEVSYEYRGDTTSSDRGENSRQTNKLEESYRLGANFAIYNPRIFKGKFSTKLLFDQIQDEGTRIRSASSKGSRLEYQFEATALERKPYSIPLFASSTASTVRRQFQSSFEATTDTYGMGLNLRNRYIPASIRYQVRETETAGQNINRINRNENFYLDASHRLGRRSSTDLTVGIFETSSSSSGGVSYQDTYQGYNTTLRNHTIWQNKKGLNRYLTTILSQQVQEGRTNTETLQGAASLAWDLGRALRGSLDLQSSRMDSDIQDRKQHSAKVELRHNLYKSLQTILQVDGRQTDTREGRETERYGLVSLQYGKSLPAEAVLSLNLYHRVGTMERDFITSELVVTQSVILPADLDTTGSAVIRLDYSDMVPGSLQILNPRSPLDIFAEYSDYELDPIFTAITFRSGLLAGGDQLLLTYRVRVNPSAVVSRQNTNLSGTLSLAKRRYVVSAAVNKQTQSQDSGLPDPAFEQDILDWRASLDVNHPNLVMRGELFGYSSNEYSYNGFEAGVRYWRQKKQSSLTLTLRDRFVTTSQGKSSFSTVRDSTNNTLAATALYRKRLFNRASLLLKGEVLTITGEYDRSQFSVDATLQTRFGRLVAELTASVTQYFTPMTDSREDQLKLRLTRYF